MVDGNHLILCVHVHNREQSAAKVQELLTEYGCYIKTRLGLHEVSESFCDAAGVLILELFGDAAQCKALSSKLSDLPGIQLQEVLFAHE